MVNRAADVVLQIGLALENLSFCLVSRYPGRFGRLTVCAPNSMSDESASLMWSADKNHSSTWGKRVTPH